MTNNYAGLRVSGYLRRAYDFDNEGQRFDLTYLEPVTVVFDETHNLTWEVTVDRNGLSSVSVSGRGINQQALRSMPIRRLRTIATTFVHNLNEEAAAPGAHLDDALAEATALARPVPLTVETLVAAWNAAPPRTRRQELSERFQVSPPTIDRWIRRARDQDLLPPPVSGRKRASTFSTSDDDESPPTERSADERPKE